MYKNFLEKVKSFFGWVRTHRLVTSVVGLILLLVVSGFVLYPFIFPPYAELTEMLNSKKYDEVITRAEYIIKYRTKDAVLLTILGNAYLGYGEENPSTKISSASKALNVLMEANSLDPKLLQPFKSRAKADIILKKYADALTALSRALAIVPNDSGLNSDLAELYFYQHDLNQSQEYFNKAVALNGNNTKAQIGLIEVYLARGQNDVVINQGVVVLSKVVDEHQRVFLKSLIGSAYLKKGNYKEAEKYFEEVIKVDESAVNLNLLADALFRDVSLVSLRDIVKSTTRPFDLALKATRLDQTYPYSYVTLYNISRLRKDATSERFYKEKALAAIEAYTQMSDSEKGNLKSYLNAISSTTLNPKTKVTVKVITDPKKIKSMTNTLTIKKK